MRKCQIRLSWLLVLDLLQLQHRDIQPISAGIDDNSDLVLNLCSENDEEIPEVKIGETIPKAIIKAEHIETKIIIP